jgi:hypothetical protein
MRAAIAILAACLAVPSLAAIATPSHPGRPPPGEPRADEPKPLGKFDNWTAAIHREGGQMVCYAFTRAQTSIPRLPARGDVVLTVTERPSGRDAVAISAGYAYPPNAEVKVRVDQAEFDFYTAQRSAFARDGHAVVVAMLKGREAVARGPGPRKVPVTDSFSLRGFDAAYAAVNKACPSR